MDIKSQKDYRRNYWALVFEGACFMGGVTLLATNGVVALFINTMTGSNTLIGLAVTLHLLFFNISQIFSAPFIRNIQNLPKFIFKANMIDKGFYLQNHCFDVIGSTVVEHL